MFETLCYKRQLHVRSAAFLSGRRLLEPIRSRGKLSGLHLASMVARRCHDATFM